MKTFLYLLELIGMGIHFAFVGARVAKPTVQELGFSDNAAPVPIDEIKIHSGSDANLWTIRGIVWGIIGLALLKLLRRKR